MATFAQVEVNITNLFITLPVPTSKIELDLRDVGLTSKPDSAIGLGGTPFAGPLTLQGWVVTWEGDSVPSGQQQFAIGLFFDNAAKITPT